MSVPPASEHTHGPFAGPYSSCPACKPVHVYGGIEHKQPGPFEDCLLCKIAALEERLAEAEGALREIAGYYAGCRSRDTGKSICANRALAALPPESEAQECEACGEPVTEAEIAAGLWCYGHGEHGPPPALPPESAEEWSEYHEFRKRTDPPPWGQGLDE